MAWTLGFVGLGAIGGVMASRLLAEKYDLHVYDIDKEKVKAMEDKGARAAESLSRLARQCDVILTSLPNPQIVKQAYLGEDGLLGSLSAGSCIIELSTIDAETMKQIASEGEAKGIRVVDAPVSGGPPEAAKGQLVMLVGADKETFELYYDILRTLGEQVYHIGPPGSGKAIKLVNNLITLGNVLVAGEAFLIGVQAGIEPHRLYEVLSQCAGRSFQFIKRFPKWMEGDFNPGYSVDLGAKDLKLLMNMAESLNRSVPLAEHIHQYYEDARQNGLGSLDILAVTKVIEQIASSKEMKA
jgi:3-hydroxyisobutyrate dehydrogenase-like beta-hydroxyacid dehydrogenase